MSSPPRHIRHRDEREAPRRAPKARPEPAERLREATFQADACGPGPLATLYRPKMESEKQGQSAMHKFGGLPAVLPVIYPLFFCSYRTSNNGKCGTLGLNKLSSCLLTETTWDVRNSSKTNGKL